MQVAAEEMVSTSASVTALFGQAPTGLGPPGSVGLPGDGQHWPPDASPSGLASHPTPGQASPSGRMDVLPQLHVHNCPA